MATGPPNGEIPLSYKLVLGGLILALWSASVVWDMVSSRYQTPLLVHGIAGAVVTFIFGQASGRAIASFVSKGVDDGK